MNNDFLGPADIPETVKLPTYNEIRSSDAPERVLREGDVATRRAWAVLDMLGGRGGFDDWFHNIDEDIQDEIFVELRTAVGAE
jgi:hypothetical protein